MTQVVPLIQLIGTVTLPPVDFYDSLYCGAPATTANQFDLNMTMKPLCFLQLSDVHSIRCSDIADAKAQWRWMHSDNLKAAIVVVDLCPPSGALGVNVTYRFSPEIGDWVETHP